MKRVLIAVDYHPVSEEEMDEIEIRRSGLDHSYIESPHHYSPRRLYSITGADWESRINFDRMRRERLERAKEAMEKHDLGAMVLYPILMFYQCARNWF